jgi:hypothetical protein
LVGQVFEQRAEQCMHRITLSGRQKARRYERRQLGERRQEGAPGRDMMLRWPTGAVLGAGTLLARVIAGAWPVRVSRLVLRRAIRVAGIQAFVDRTRDIHVIHDILPWLKEYNKETL